MPTKVNAAAAPHSWSIETWPAHVYPGTTDRARYFIRVHKNALFAAGALTRPGREIVIIGAPYCRWLEKQVVNVPDYNTGAAIARDVSKGRAGVPEVRGGSSR
jgi:hypothetical protein